MCATRTAPLGSWLTGEQFHLPKLVLQKCRPCPCIVFVLGKQMPGEDSDLASRGDSRNLLAASALDANEERPQWSRSTRRCPGRLHEHGTCVCTAMLADMSVMGWAIT